jgi:iron(III) transport system permease protein
MIWLQSLGIALGGGCLAVLLASAPALASILVLNPRFQRLVAGAMTSLVLLPKYVVVGAWSAGFGVQGWWTLSQVTAAQLPIYGVASVVWLQAVALTPVAYWLLRIGLRRTSHIALELASQESGVARQWRHVILPAWIPWLLMSSLICATMIASDMVVSNLFQVRTWTEIAYLSIQAGAPTWLILVKAAGLSLGFAWLSCLGWSRIEWRSTKATSHLVKINLATPTRRVFLLFIAILLLIIVGIPLISLVVKAGWLASQDSSGVIDRSWSLTQAMNRTVSAAQDFQSEFAWSIALCAYSATLALLVGHGLSLFLHRAKATENQSSRWSRSKIVARLIIMLLVTAFAMPGPMATRLINLSFQSAPEPWPWLNDHTLIAPILCLQFRLLPMATGVLWLRRGRWIARYGELWRLDQSLSWATRFVVVLRIGWFETLVAFGLLFAIAFGELSCYLLSLPPGVTTIAMRIFDLLHYGVRAPEAGLLLLLALIAMLTGYLVTLKGKDAN